MSDPIACRLTAAELADRARETAGVAAVALGSRTPIPGGERLRFAALGDTEARLRAVVAAEARCCPFLRLDLRVEGPALVLDVTGPELAAPIIAGLFASDAG